MLQRYEKRDLCDEEFRILQGVLLKDFGNREQKRKQKKALVKEKNALFRYTTANSKQLKSEVFVKTGTNRKSLMVLGENYLNAEPQTERIAHKNQLDVPNFNSFENLSLGEVDEEPRPGKIGK